MDWGRSGRVFFMVSAASFSAVSSRDFYHWKGKFGGMEVSEARRLRALEEENRQLKYIVPEQAVDIRALKAVVTKKW